MDSLRRNDVFEVVTDKDVDTLSTKMLFKVKRDGDGSVRHKARLVVRGFEQQHGVDYWETFAPVVRFTTIRTILSVAAEKGWAVRQLDIQTAFLYGELDEVIYVKPPPGLGGEVWRLKKSLYGLKQAPRQWHRKLTGTLQQLNFRASDYDPSLFIKDNEIFITIYVDDLLVIGPTDQVGETVAKLGGSFCIKDFGNVNLLLGVEVARQERTFSLTQAHYILECQQKFGVVGTATTPLPAGFVITPCGPDDTVLNATDALAYRSRVGAVMFVALATRPDLAAPIGMLARHVAKPTTRDMDALHHLLRYMCSTANMKLVIGGAKCLIGYTDSDWASDKENRRSTFGYCYSLGMGVVCWSSRQQKSVALSTAEAEFVAASEAIKDGVWLRGLLSELSVQLNSGITLFCDNMAAIHLMNNPVHHNSVKHIDIRYKYVREIVTSGVADLIYVKSCDNVADALTKPLSTEVLSNSVKGMGLRCM